MSEAFRHSHYGLRQRGSSSTQAHADKPVQTSDLHVHLSARAEDPMLDLVKLLHSVNKRLGYTVVPRPTLEKECEVRYDNDANPSPN